MKKLIKVMAYILSIPIIVALLIFTVTLIPLGILSLVDTELGTNAFKELKEKAKKYEN